MSNVFNSNSMNPSKHIVENFWGAKISWADTYTDAASRSGFDILQTTSNDTYGDKIFLGDKLPVQLGANGIHLYFLAAADGTDTERESSLRTDGVTTVSNAEKSRLLATFPDIEAWRVSVDGFPVYNEDVYDTITRRNTMSQVGSVAFLGRAVAEKGPLLEIKLAKELVRSGLRVLHMSNTVVPIANELQNAGVRVYENIQGEAYLQRLADVGAVINTSPRESLFVSGIEASVLGVPVFAPDNAESGIWDWNIIERKYDAADINSTVDMVRDTLAQKTTEISIPDVSRYESAHYFKDIAQRMDELRD